MRLPLVVLALLTFGCDSTPAPSDAGPDGGGTTADAGEAGGCGPGYTFPALRASHSTIGVTPGASRSVRFDFARDCPSGTILALTTSAPGIIQVPATVAIAPGRARASLDVLGVAPGVVTLTATASFPGDVRTAEIEVAVTEMALPSCGGSASGNVTPGATLEVTSGTLSGASITLPEGAARDDLYHVDAFAGSIECGEDLVPTGYLALGPPVRFGPVALRMRRDVPLAIPIRLSLLPSGAHRGHVELMWRGERPGEARSIGFASPRFVGSAGDGRMLFEVPRLGTYQAVVRTDAPTRRERNFTFRGIMGFSMGGSGTGRVGMGSPERFDFVAPLGGPTDWTWLLEYMRNYHVAGFCTEVQRQMDPAGCEAGASLARTPPVTQLHEHPQHFEHWWFDEGLQDPGGIFDRESYISIFRDLAAMFGNPNSDRGLTPSDPNVTPPGVPDSVRQMSERDRCMPANQIVIPPFDGTAGDWLSGTAGRGFFDDDYNPAGQYPVITFCDGGDPELDHGLWDPSLPQEVPVEVVLAVDINGNGLRDRGEPVIRNGREPFRDWGLDGVPSAMEPSYDPITNPDPAGDDFDFQYNPTGTENNWDRDTIDGDRCRAAAPNMAEPFDDVGLDGVPGTPQLAAGGFDHGEGNGCFDRTAGAYRMIESSPRYAALHATDAVLRDVDIYADGGIRDLFNWAVMANVTMAGFAARGLPIRYFNTHASLHLDDRRDSAFDWTAVPWDEVGRYAAVRYGDVDATGTLLRAGDGGHVGTANQILWRFLSAIYLMDRRWPDGDRARVTDTLCTEERVARGACTDAHGFHIDFTSTRGRTGPVEIILPPGYFDPANDGVRYPVVYFLHGYGMEPEDLSATGYVIWNEMISPSTGTESRFQKMILVFPDGRCRGGECRRGTFYTDAPESTPGGPQMQTFLLDLMDHVDATYRTRPAERIEVVE